MALAKESPSRNLNDLDTPLNCVFNDIIRLDFTKFKQTLNEYTVVMKEQEMIDREAAEERQKAK